MLLHVTFKIKIQFWEGKYFAARNQQLPSVNCFKVLKGGLCNAEF